MFGSAMSVALEVPGIIKSIDKGKSVPRAILNEDVTLLMIKLI